MPPIIEQFDVPSRVSHTGLIVTAKIKAAGVCVRKRRAHTQAMKNTLHSSTRRGGVVVQHDSTISGPVALGDAMLALGRIAAELLLDLNNGEVIPVAA